MNWKSGTIYGSWVAIQFREEPAQYYELAIIHLYKNADDSLDNEFTRCTCPPQRLKVYGNIAIKVIKAIKANQSADAPNTACFPGKLNINSATGNA